MGIVGFWLPWAGVPFQSLVGVDDDSFKKKKKNGSGYPFYLSYMFWAPASVNHFH